MTDFHFPEKNAGYTQTEEKIIDYFYQNINLIPFLSIGTISEKLGVSEATLSRFAKNAGFKNFKELKAAIAEKYETPAEKMTGTLAEKSGIFEMLEYQRYCIEKTMLHLSESEVKKAVDKIAAAKTVYIYGKGASLALAELFSFRLSRLGKMTKILPSGGSELFEGLVHAKEGDLALIFGFQKIPREAKVILEHSKTAGFKTILISGMLFNDQNKHADINLFVYRGEPKEYHSMAAPAALIDAITVLLAKSLGNAAMENLANLYNLKEKYKEEIPR